MITCQSVNHNLVCFFVELPHHLANGDGCLKFYVKNLNSHILKQIIWVAKSKWKNLITSTVSTLYLYSTLLRTKVLVVQPPSESIVPSETNAVLVVEFAFKGMTLPLMDPTWFSIIISHSCLVGNIFFPKEMVVDP
jgi:hypothetical protein